MNKSRLFGCGLLALIFFSTPNNAFPQDDKSDLGDELRYQEERPSDLPQVVKRLKFEKEEDYRNHLYGYFGLSYAFESNPAHERSQGSHNDSDSYLYGKAYIAHALDLTQNTAWLNKISSAGRFYAEREDLDDSYTVLETGPGFYISSIYLALSPRFRFSIATEDRQLYYYAPGLHISMDWLQYKRFNLSFSYRYEERDYDVKNTNQPDRDVHKFRLQTRIVPIRRNIFKVIPIYQNHDADVQYLQKEVYGVSALYYLYVLKNTYIGGSYEYFMSQYKNVRPSESRKQHDVEQYWTGFIGQEFDNWIVRFAYSREKEYSNLDRYDTSWNDLYVLSLTYRFHLPRY